MLIQRGVRGPTTVVQSEKTVKAGTLEMSDAELHRVSELWPRFGPVLVHFWSYEFRTLTCNFFFMRGDDQKWSQLGFSKCKGITDNTHIDAEI